MPISPTAAFAPQQTSATSSSQDTSGMLGQDAFLKLLIAQMRNQDPLAPAKDTEFIGQMAQFQVLEELQRLNQMVAYQVGVEGLMQASGLIGKEVTTFSANDLEPVTGVVSRVSLQGGEVVLTIDGRQAYLSDVIQVGT